MEQKKGLICLIEDNKSISKLFATILRKNGYETVEFETARSALDWLKNNKPHCILTDVLLPDMNGTELLVMIRSEETLKHLPVIAITGLAQPGDETKLLAAGFDGYMSKPINVATFVQDIENIVNSKKEQG
ncbi:MAG: response regulator [Candidatus Kapaibacteriota bacterium]|jgi:two-component system cell cycle response regulator DivK